MKHFKLLMAGVILVGMSAAAHGDAFAQMSKARPMAAMQMEEAVTLKISGEEASQSQKMQIEALSKSLVPKIQRAAEQQGVKASSREILEASQKLAMVMVQGDIIDVDTDVPEAKIDVEVTVKFRPLKISIKLTF